MFASIEKTGLSVEHSAALSSWMLESLSLELLNGGSSMFNYLLSLINFDDFFWTGLST